MSLPELQPAFVAALSFHAHYAAGSAKHDWTDLMSVLAFDLSGRQFQAVIGMDILSKGRLAIGGGAVSFEF